MISYPPFSGGGGYVNRLCSGGGKGVVVMIGVGVVSMPIVCVVGDGGRGGVYVNSIWCWGVMVG